jgi:hypothetical protein
MDGKMRREMFGALQVKGGVPTAVLNGTFRVLAEATEMSTHPSRNNS